MSLPLTSILVQKCGFVPSIYSVLRDITVPGELPKQHPEHSRGEKIQKVPLVVSVYVDRDILTHLNMKNHERKNRIMLSRSVESYSIKSIRGIIETKCPSLVDQPYKLRYNVPTPNGGRMISGPKAFLDDADARDAVTKITAKALSLGSSKPGALHLYVQKVPGEFPPAAEPYLQGMNDPAETETYTMLSFYAFGSIVNPEVFSERLRSLWEPFLSLGRVYVAEEGVNAQMAVPTNVIHNFQQATESETLFTGIRLNTDHTMTVGEFDSSRPFKALHIRVRDQIVTDGFDEPLDWGTRTT